MDGEVQAEVDGEGDQFMVEGPTAEEIGPADGAVDEGAGDAEMDGLEEEPEAKRLRESHDPPEGS